MAASRTPQEGNVQIKENESKNISVHRVSFKFNTMFLFLGMLAKNTEASDLGQLVYVKTQKHVMNFKRGNKDTM